MWGQEGQEAHDTLTRKEYSRQGQSKQAPVASTVYLGNENETCGFAACELGVSFPLNRPAHVLNKGWAFSYWEKLDRWECAWKGTVDSGPFSLASW